MSRNHQFNRGGSTKEQSVIVLKAKTDKASLKTFAYQVAQITTQATKSNKRGLKPKQRLFDISVRTVQNHLQLTCDYLGFGHSLGTHAFRKFFAQSIYENNNFDIVLVKELLQHSSVAITQRYVGVGSQRVEQALQNHVVLPT